MGYHLYAATMALAKSRSEFAEQGGWEHYERTRRGLLDEVGRARKQSLVLTGAVDDLMDVVQEVRTQIDPNHEAVGLLLRAIELLRTTQPMDRHPWKYDPAELEKIRTTPAIPPQR